MHKLKLREIKEIAKQTFAFYFEKPEGFEYSSGQTMRLKRPGSDESKTFSMASAPHEDDLVFAARHRGSQFKKVLVGLKAGAIVEADGPLGERFVLHEDTNVPAVFIAGGVGITPILSMLSHITQKKLPYQVTLLYSNRREEDIPFLTELRAIGKEHDNIKVVQTLTRDFKKDPAWEGERGYIDEGMLKKHIQDISKPIFYISGSPMMVVGVRNLLEKVGVPDNHILTKKFTGY
jgi:ferredoxin-NADP reductase|tara:strand:+ start:10612 stop:11313 length:702 start_codon:yes stop_codon:yes gene_type:complete